MFEKLSTYLNETVRAMTGRPPASRPEPSGNVVETGRAPLSTPGRRSPGLMDIGGTQPDYRIFVQ